MGTQIKIYVVKTELLKGDSPFNKTGLSLLEAIKEDLINMYGGLSVSPQFIGFWKDTTSKHSAWVDGHICKVDKDVNEIWEILTDLNLLDVDNKQIATETMNLIQSIKIVTKQKSQLFTINRNIEINYI
jgi:hypothetical protein